MPAGAARDLCLGQAAYDGQQEQRDACNERRMKRSGVAPVSMTAGIGTRRQNASWYLSEKESSAIYVTRLPCGTRRADAVLPNIRGEQEYRLLIDGPVGPMAGNRGVGRERRASVSSARVCPQLRRAYRHIFLAADW